MTDKKSNESRRILLKSIAAGSGAVVAGKSLPESWSRPVVDSVMLPAHAQTSIGPFSGTAVQRNGALELDSIFEQVADSLVPRAEALIALENPYVCVIPNATMDAATVKLYIDEPDTRLYEFFDVPVGGSKCTFQYTYQCVDAANKLFDDFGLIKDANAGSATCEGCCYLDSTTGRGAGRLEICGITIDFDVGPNECSPTINCVE